MNDKKEKVLKEGEESSLKKASLIIGILLLIAIGGYIFLKPANTPAGAAVSSGLEPMDYTGIRADIVDVDAVEKGELVGVSLADLKKYKMVYFKYQSIPLMAYIDNKGYVITAVAMCEPCRNDHDFFIQDNILVCGKCWTRWKLTSHKGISGGCKDYPPEILSNNIVGDGVFVNKKDVIAWEPRV